MTNPSPALKGVIRGKTIELETDPGLLHGQEVTVEIRPADEPPRWLERLDVDPSVRVGKLVVKGTRLLVDDLVELVEAGLSDDDLRARHPELTPDDMEAIRNYARVPLGLRRSFGAWADEADELDRFVEWTYQQRKVGNRPVDL